MQDPRVIRLIIHWGACPTGSSATVDELPGTSLLPVAGDIARICHIVSSLASGVVGTGGGLASKRCSDGLISVSNRSERKRRCKHEEKHH